MTELELRVRATEATFARFHGQLFELGKNDCARMVAFHLRQLGHRASLLNGGRYSTPVGARKALQRLGVSSLTEIMDQRFPRISPAEARTGDVLAGVSESGEGDAMAIRLHRQNALAFLDGVCGEVIISDYVAAWRVV